MSKLTHTCGYKVGIDEEVKVGNDIYYCTINLDVDFDSEAEASSVEVVDCKIEGPNDGQMQSWTTEGRRIEKVIVHGEPDLTEAIDKAIWKEIQLFAEDNYSDIARDVDEDYEASYAEWHKE
jgi:hypothetical protein